MFATLLSTSILGIGAGLIAALLLGAGDYISGFVAEKTNSYITLAVIYLVEFLIMGTIVLIRGDFGSSQENLKMIGGAIAGNIGFLVLVLGLSKGNISIVASISGIAQLVLPLIFSIYIDEDKLSKLTWVGIVIAAISIIFISIADEQNELKRSTLYSIMTGLISGLSLSIFVTAMVKIQTSTEMRLFNVAVPATVLSITYILLHKKRFIEVLKYYKIILCTCVGYLLGLWALAYSGHHVSLLISTLLISLVPVVTVGLARLHKNEKISKIQYGGFAIAGVGVVIIAIGLS